VLNDRGDYIGQFGVGMLSAFMVADEIVVTSQSATPGTKPIRWIGRADGTYELTELDTLPGGPGSSIVLAPRHGMEHWTDPAMVASLVQEFGALLPVEVTVADPQPRRITTPELPWERTFSNPADRQAALTRYCKDTLGFEPLACIDLNLPTIGLSGVGFVLPTAATPAAANPHRVYLKRMLLGSHVGELLPNWAFFVRCVVNTSVLRPTASREALYEDELMLATRDALGQKIIDWAVTTLREDSALQRSFVNTHQLAIRSLALHNDDLLELAAQVLPYETTDGARTLTQVLADHGEIKYCASIEEYRRVAPIAAAHSIGLVNAGYVYDADLFARLAARHPDWKIAPLGTSDIEQVLDALDPAEELAFWDLLETARTTLEDIHAEPVIRTFDPPTVPTMLLTDADTEHQAALEATQAAAPSLWSGVLGQFGNPANRRKLVFNARNQAVQDLATVEDPGVRAAGIRTLYVTARLLAGEVLHHRDAQLLNESLDTLLNPRRPH
jgi:molecular chaperone HtpG